MRISRREWLALSAGATAGLALPAFGQDEKLRLETIREIGPASNRLNFVFAAEGYDARSLEQFDRTISDLTRRLGEHAVFGEYSNFINTYRIREASSRPWDGTGKGTVFGVRVGSQNQDLVLDWAAAAKKLPASMPKNHVLAIIVNGAEALRSKGGGAPRQGRLATGSTWDIFLHEIGHALGMLGDEYPDGGALSEELSINVSPTGRDVPWAPLLEGSPRGLGITKVPGIHRTFWKGEEQCIMAQNSNDFGPVCRWGMVLGILRHVRLIEESTPARDQVVTPKTADRLDIKTLAPRGHGLRVRWVSRSVASAKEFAAMQFLTPKAVRWETLEREKGWEPLRTAEGGVRLSELAPGRHIVVAFIEDRHDWIVQDPWGTSRDVAAWAVEIPEK